MQMLAQPHERPMRNLAANGRLTIQLEGRRLTFTRSADA
jgi:hypothetical protein